MEKSLIQQVGEATFPVTKPQTASGRVPDFSGVLDFYLNWHEVEGHSPATISAFRQHISAFFNDVAAPLEQVGTIQIVQHLHTLKARGLSPFTVRSRFRHLSAFFNWAATWELIERDPMKKLKQPTVPRIRKPFMTDDDFARLLAVCPEHTFLGSRDRAMLLVTATAGLRVSELVSLQLDSVNLQTRMIRVIGKGAKQRTVPLHLEAHRAMLKYFAIRRRRWGHDPSPALWISEEGSALRHNGAKMMMSRLRTRSGVTVKDAWHVLRRTWAAAAVRQGIPRPYIQTAAGWSTPAMLDHYTAAMLDEEAAVEAFRGFRLPGR